MASVKREQKNNNFSIISNYYLQDKRLSLKAKGLLSVILSLPDDWNYSKNGLISICKEGENAVESVLNELKEYGYIQIKKLNGINGKFKYEYTITEKPDP